MFLKTENANGKNERNVEQPKAIIKNIFSDSSWYLNFCSRKQYL